MSWFDDNLTPAPTIQAQRSDQNPTVYNGPAIGAPGTNTGITGGALSIPPQAAADPNTLIAQWQSSHPLGQPGSSIKDLAAFLQQNGVNATVATHGAGAVNGVGGNLESDDKLMINGGPPLDYINNVGGPNQSWALPTAGGDANQGQGGGMMQGGGAISRLYNPNDLTAGWTEQFQAPTAEQAMNSPGIQAALKLGQQAIERSAAGKGTLLTGGTLKDLTSFANDVGSQAYGDVYSRAKGEFSDARDTFFANQRNLFDRNFSLADLGTRAAGAAGSAEQTNANAQTGLFGDQGNAASAGTVAGTNAWMPTIGALTNLGVDATTRNRTSY